MSFQNAPWPLPKGVFAGWTTRSGGISNGAFESFNLALHVEDDEQNVMDNRLALQNELVGRPEVIWLNQTHSSVVVETSRANKHVGQDGSYTQALNQACCVMTADCLPVFFWDQQGDQIAIAHAGWRGLADHILVSTLGKFAQPERVSVGIGPAIGKTVFEVGDDVVDAFAGWPDKDHFFKPRSINGKHDCDLSGLAEAQLREMGVQSVYQSGLCTYQRNDQFFSYRRDGQTGRMANLIWKIA